MAVRDYTPSPIAGPAPCAAYANPEKLRPNVAHRHRAPIPDGPTHNPASSAPFNNHPKTQQPQKTIFFSLLIPYAPSERAFTLPTLAFVTSIARPGIGLIMRKKLPVNVVGSSSAAKSNAQIASDNVPMASIKLRVAVWRNQARSYNSWLSGIMNALSLCYALVWSLSRNDALRRLPGVPRPAPTKSCFGAVRHARKPIILTISGRAIRENSPGEFEPREMAFGMTRRISDLL